MKAVLLACNSLETHVKAAQETMNTDHPVVYIDSKYHIEPKDMREQLIKTMKELPEDADTVLVAMGFCGGSWENVPIDKRVVIPRVDDCITMLLHTDDTWYPDLKQPGHLYLHDANHANNKKFSPAVMKEKLCLQYGEMNGTFIFNTMFASYTNVDIISTGAYDCYSEEYIEEAEKNAKLIHSVVDYVEGSNIILEKLVSGRWDQQFLVVEPGQLLTNSNFLP